MNSRRLWLVVISVVVLGVTAGLASQAAGGNASRRSAARAAGAGRGPWLGRRWVASWMASPEAAEPGRRFVGGFRNQTVRDVIHASLGGTRVRIRVTNAFGRRRLRIGLAAVSAPGRGPVPVTFAGRRSVTIPPGGRAFSDPINLVVRPLERLAVSMFLPAATGPPTEHFDAHQTSYVAAGDQVMAGRNRFRKPIQSWYFLSGLDVWSPARGAVVAFGDSITNGNGSVTGAFARWPNDLVRRLEARSPGTLSVVDAGIEGNRVLNPSRCCGQSALARFSRDVLHQPGVKEVIVLEGINDIGFARSSSPLTTPHASVSAAQVIAGYEALIRRAHAAGLKIFGATLTPFAGSQHWTPAGEAERERINAWIRSSHAFDGVIDFASAVADPSDPQRVNPRYDDGDHLHLNDAGYRTMAGAINLAMLLRGLNRMPSR